MNSKYKYLISILFVLTQLSSRAHEGMWIPFLLEQQVFSEMQKAGCKLSPDDIYNANQACLSDAIVKIGQGCSGGILSKNGLVITNHHCIKYFIQSNSSVNNNLLKDGFFAQDYSQELPAKGLSVTVLHSMVDVTEILKASINNQLSIHQIDSLVMSRCDSVLADCASTDDSFQYSIEPFYGGNQFFLFTSKKYDDIRLVAFPPKETAAMGNSKDNWMWPRHDADFGLLRIYTDSTNKPNQYAHDNIPFTPEAHLKISLRDIKEDDFTMTLGYPAVTNNYSSSQEVQLICDSLNPMYIALKQLRIKPMEAYMATSDSAYLAYYTKHFYIDNFLVKLIGQTNGIKQSNAVVKKKNLEDSIRNLYATTPQKEAYIDSLFTAYDLAITQNMHYQYNAYLYVESIWQMDFFNFASTFFPLYKSGSPDKFEDRLLATKNASETYYKTVNIPLESQTFSAVIKFVNEHIQSEYLPEFYAEMNEVQRQRYITEIISTSVLFNEQAARKFLAKINKKKYINDPSKILDELMDDKGLKFVRLVQLSMGRSIYPNLMHTKVEVDYYKKKYLQVLLDVQNGTYMSPDANGTLRVSFGKIKSYENFENITNPSFTYASDILNKWEKDSLVYPPNNKLRTLFQTQDYGQYSTDTLRVSFIATNQTTGGNSGSPVLDANGYFIGLNHDRNQEGTMSDLYYDASICRNISVDVRYILFMLEKYGEAHNIINELDITENE